MSVTAPLKRERFIIVDYDNIDFALRRKGLFSVIWKILEKAVNASEEKLVSYTIRLYGGWYSGTQLTRSAQDLVIEIGNDLPRIFPLVMDGKPLKISIQTELAYSLTSIPNKHLLATFRKRPFRKNVQCEDPRANGCTATECPMVFVESFFSGRKCPGNPCGSDIKDFLFLGEQKLVDTMMLSDLIFLSNRGERKITLVSSDDDLWPGILTSLIAGAEVLHIRTRKQNKDTYGYARDLPGTYRTTTL